MHRNVFLSALRWPPFLYAIFLLYWSTAFGTLTYRVEWLNFRKKRSDVLGWTRAMKLFFRYTALQVGDQQLYRNDCMYLINHRSWADFIVDQYVTEGRSMFMSRWAVFFVFPMFMFAINTIQAVLLFKRGSVNDKDAFNKWIDKDFAASPQTAIAVYPEGHRSTRRESLPLKTGMLKYAYSRKLPVQIIIGANKESILSEKHRTARLGQTVAVGFSDVIRAEEYETFNDYMAKVQQVWDAQWKKVFSADFSKLPVLPEAKPYCDLPMPIRLKMVIIAPVTTAIFFYVMYLTFLVARNFLSLFGAFQLPVLALFTVYIALSFYVYSKPVDALTVHESMRKQAKRGPSPTLPLAEDKQLVRNDISTLDLFNSSNGMDDKLE